MKFTCLREKLLKSFNLASHVVSKNISLPILGNFLLETDKGKLKISATNLETALKIWVPGKVEQEGKVCLPSNVVSAAVANSQSDKVLLESVENTNLRIYAGDYEAIIRGNLVDDFPAIPNVLPTQKNKSINIPAPLLYEALNQLVNIITISETRPEISGILFSFSNNSLKLAATDSFRLGEKIIPINDKEVDIEKDFSFKSFILPAKGVNELLRILTSQQDVLSVLYDENQALFVLDGIHLVSRLIEGQFPDYEKIIPNEFLTEVLVNKNELMQKIRAVSIFTSRTNDIKIEINSKDQKIILESASSETGQSKSSISCSINGDSASISCSINGDSAQISFNWKYLYDGLANLTTDQAILCFNTGQKPALIRGKGDKSYFYLAMPIRE